MDMHRLVLVAVLAASAVAPAHARPQVHFILSHDSAAYHAVVGGARDTLAGAADVSAGHLAEPIPAAAVLVAVGSEAAARWVPSDDPRPVFATLVPAAAWPALVADPRGGERSALFLDQPLVRQVGLLRVLLPPIRDLGVVYGPTSVAQREELDAAGVRFRLSLHATQVDAGAEINGAVSEILRRSEALLALPDQAVFNAHNVQSILLGSFRARRPVIGISAAWVRAGALAAIHSEPAALGRELGTTVATWLAGDGPVPAARAPADFALSVNRQVAFSLGLDLPPDAVLKARLRALLEAS